MQLLDKILVKLGHNIGLPSKYLLLKKIGAGAEGEVWLGLDEEIRAMVAIKFIPRGAPAWKLDMAKREFSMLCRLGPGHLNIVRPLELVLTSKHLALITEYVPGGSLSDHLARQSLSEDVARYFFKQVLAAVAFCHARKIVYRDIKPANVLITGTKPPFLKLCDFGLADSWETRSEPSFKSLVGTPGYMAPEIMASFFTTAAVVAQRSHCASGPGTPPAAAAADREAAASPHASASPAAKGKTRKKATDMLKPSASGKLTSKVVAAATTAAAAARAAVAAVPGSRGGSNGSSAFADDGDPEAQPELAAVMATYDGQQADVFSLGVMLVVMLLRHMPWNYDSIATRLPLLKAMLVLHELAVVNKVSWRAATSHADTLSPDLCVLLDAMLEPDPQKRATLQQVADSPWVNAPLPHRLQCAVLVIGEQQQARERQFNSAKAVAAAQAGKSCFQENTALSAAMQQQLDAMMAAAKSVGKGYKLELRLDLMQQLSQQDLSQQTNAHAFQADNSPDLCDASSEECCTTAVVSAPVAAARLDEAAAGSMTFLEIPTKPVQATAASAPAVSP